MIDWSVFLLRVVTGLMFLESGGRILFGWFGGAPGEMSTIILVAGILEFIGGLALILGIFVRPVAFILSGLMAVAYFMAHAKAGNWYAPVANNGMPAVLLSFISLFFAAYGAGTCSLGKRK